MRHIFTHLGEAPYRYDGYEKKLFIVQGEPPRAGSTCDHCGTAIADCFWFRSADGKRFKVGSTCVEKSGDKGLKRVISADVAKARRLAAKKLDTKKTAVVEDLLADEGVKLKLQALPHPSFKGRSLLDYVEWMMAHSGRTGRAKVAKILREAL